MMGNKRGATSPSTYWRYTYQAELDYFPITPHPEVFFSYYTLYYIISYYTPAIGQQCLHCTSHILTNTQYSLSLNWTSSMLDIQSFECIVFEYICPYTEDLIGHRCDSFTSEELKCRWTSCYQLSASPQNGKL